MGDWPLFPNFSDSVFYGKSGSDTWLFTITSGASNNTKGSWYEYIASTPFSASGIILFPNYASDYSFLVDIGIGAAGSEIPLISNLLRNSVGVNTRFFGTPIFVPLGIPQGSRIVGRAQSSLGNQGVRFGITLLRGDHIGQPLQRIDTYGANTATTYGTTVDPGGVAHTKGAWVELSSGLLAPTKGFSLGFSDRGNAAKASSDWLFDVGIGAAGSEQVILGNVPLLCLTGASPLAYIYTPFLPFAIPSGTRVAARSQCSVTDATDRLIDVILYAGS
jgi:hypothetical protein